MTDKMLSRKDGAVGWMTFNNPERHNAVSLEMWLAAERILTDFASDPAVRVVVVTGAGGKAFVSGADISKFESERASADAVEAYSKTTDRVYKLLADLPKPTIAMIRGYCIGGGVNVAISCDIRLAASDSVYAVPATRLGLGYRFSALKNLVDLVGPGFAKDIFFTGRRLPAAEALAIGLVNRVVPVEEVDALVAEYATMIATGAPLTVKAGKRIIREVLKPDADIDMDLCRRLILDCFESEDYAEGRTAFMEKRKPVFRGK